MYRCDVPERTEAIPYFSKTMSSKVVTREFNKEVSVFKAWKQDTDNSLAEAFKQDIKHWKGYRFIKADEDREATEAVLKKNFKKIKDIFVYCTSQSAFPTLTQLDFADFATKAKL